MYEKMNSCYVVITYLNRVCCLIETINYFGKKVFIVNPTDFKVNNIWLQFQLAYKVSIIFITKLNLSAE